MCKFRGRQNSQASEANKNINTVKTSNKLNLSSFFFSSPRLAAKVQRVLREVRRIPQGSSQTSVLGEMETTGTAGVTLLVARV